MGNRFTSIRALFCLACAAALLPGMGSAPVAHAQQGSGVELACSIEDTVSVTGEVEHLTLTVRIKNTTPRTFTDARLVLLPPPSVMLDDGEHGSKEIEPDPLPPWQPGTPLPEITWELRYGAWTEFCRDTEICVQVLGTALDSTGMPISFDCCATFVVRGVDRAQPPLIVTMTGSTPSCDSIVLDAGPGYARYHWSTGDTTQHLVVRQSGRYWVETWTAPCYLGISEPHDLEVYPLPAAPVITRTHNTLTIPDEYASYQWLRNGVPMPGETGPQLTVPGPGFYRVVVTNMFGCENSSGEFDVTVLGIPAAAASAFDVDLFPLPARDAAVVRLQGAMAHAAQLTLHDGLGRIVLSLRLEAGENPSARLDVAALPAGMYVLRIRGASVNARRLLPVQ